MGNSNETNNKHDFKALELEAAEKKASADAA